MSRLRTPIVAVIAGEGGSGGALALAVADVVIALENAVYSVITPEGCAAILWGDGAKAPEAAELMRVTAPDLLKLGVIDGIVPEPVGGAHRNWDATAASLRAALRDQLWQLKSKSEAELIEERQEKFRRIGVFEETV
jgi:acetyl-CoA carboxylase carboxyl transferase subunit alpha